VDPEESDLPSHCVLQQMVHPLQSRQRLLTQIQSFQELSLPRQKRLKLLGE
jgi:hypothetical protein